MQLGSLGGPLAVGAALALAGERRHGARVAAVGAFAWAAAKAVKPLVRRGRPAHTVDVARVLGRTQAGLGYPSGHAAVAAATTALVAPRLPRPWGAVAWAWGLAVGPLRTYVGAHLPLDVVGARRWASPSARRPDRSAGRWRCDPAADGPSALAAWWAEVHGGWEQEDAPWPPPVIICRPTPRPPPQLRRPRRRRRSTGRATPRSAPSTASRVAFEARPLHRHHGPVGLREVDAAALHRGPRHPDVGQGLHRRHRPEHARRHGPHVAPPRPRRVRLPGVQPGPDPDRRGEHHAAPGARRPQGRQGVDPARWPTRWA